MTREAETPVAPLSASTDQSRRDPSETAGNGRIHSPPAAAYDATWDDAMWDDAMWDDAMWDDAMWDDAMWLERGYCWDTANPRNRRLRYASPASLLQLRSTTNGVRPSPLHLLDDQRVTPPH